MKLHDIILNYTHLIYYYVKCIKITMMVGTDILKFT